MALTLSVLSLSSLLQAQNSFTTEIGFMKYDETPLLSSARLAEARDLGAMLRELRHAYRMRQADVAARAGLSRSTVALIEKGDVGRTLGQLLRYLHAIEPEATFAMLMDGGLLAIQRHRALQRAMRVRLPSKKELKKLDF